jgi:hypothetical protein
MFTPIKRYHRTDGWRGYFIPANAIAGSSDTGLWSDSPCPSNEVKAELRRFVKECLKPLGIRTRQRYSKSTNCFMVKRWVVVAPEDFNVAATAATHWLANHDHELRYVHDADLDKCMTKEAA